MYLLSCVKKKNEPDPPEPSEAPMIYPKFYVSSTESTMSFG